ncbi:MAG: hypothetical protein ACFFDC_12430 [Promethearchaeota archaeon]
MMLCFKRIGFILSIFVLLGINLNSLNGFYQPTDLKTSTKLGNTLRSTQIGSEFLPDNSTWTDYPIDDDQNGYYDRLIINLGPPKSLNENFGIYGVLNDSKGNLLGVTRISPWQLTLPEILVSFPGQPINMNGENGSYRLWIGTYESGWWGQMYDLQMLYSYITTFDYNPEDFETPRGQITGISDSGNDSDDDEIIDEIVFNFTVEIKDPGEYNLVMSLDSSTPFAGLGQEFHWGGFLTPESTSIVMKISILDNDLHGPLNVSYIKFELYGIVMQFLTEVQTINSYFISSPTYAKLTGKYWDWGLDNNFNGKFDQLVIIVEVNITLAGFYNLDMHLTTVNYDQGGWDEWTDHNDFFNVNLHNLSFHFDASLLYSHRSDLSFKVEYISIMDESYSDLIDEASSPYTTRVYNYTEFDIPKAFLTGNFWDWGVDTNFDGKYDQLVITAEINATDTGTYILQLNVHPFGTDWGDWSQYVEFNQYWSMGVSNVSVSIDANQFYSLRNDTSFQLEYVRIREWEDWNEIDYYSSPYLTRVYNYSEFDFPDAAFTGNYWIQGYDSEADSRFESLIFDIEINVTESNYYEIQIEVRSVIGDFQYWWSVNEYFKEGLHWLKIEIDGSELFWHRLNSSYIVNSYRIYRTSNYEWYRVDQGYFDYSTRIFNFTEFTPPSAYLTGQYWDRGVDTDFDGKFDEIVIDAEVNVTQEGDYFVELQLRPYIPVWDSYFWGSSLEGINYAPGIQNISVQLYVTLPYVLRLDTAYIIEFIRVYETEWDWEEIDSLEDAYITKKYKFFAFDFPGATLTRNFWDSGIDTDASGRYDLMKFDIELNVNQSGTYNVEFFIHSEYWEYSESKSFPYSFEEGVHNISHSFNTLQLFPLYGNPRFFIENIRIYDSEYHLLDRSIDTWITKAYNLYAFDPPAMFLTDIFFDYGEDTDDDDKFEELHFYIGINVTETDTYRIDLAIEVSMWDEGLNNWDSYSFDTYITQYLEEGIDIYIILLIDAEMLYFPQYDYFRVELRSINIFDSTNNLCYSDDWIGYSTNEYPIDNFEFIPNSIITTTWTLTTSTDSFPYLDTSPTWNVAFGIIVLFFISIMLYLLQRPKIDR